MCSYCKLQQYTTNKVCARGNAVNYLNKHYFGFPFFSIMCYSLLSLIILLLDQEQNKKQDKRILQL